MTTNLHKESATIYQFPVGGRAGLASRPAPVSPTTQRVNETVCSSGSWYHEEAIRDAAVTRNN